ncbi:hypothetical protein A6U86_23340 [Rhizobium sp. AC27/96]|nr:hypothetical protein A6U86_23340 [Rhizobium sp. AC27/96]
MIFSQNEFRQGFWLRFSLWSKDGPPALVVRDGPLGLLTMRATSLTWLAIRSALILSLSKDQGGPHDPCQS